MEEVKINERQDGLHWSYDADADVLYIAVERPREAAGVDLGHGLVARYDERTGNVVGLTVIGLRARIEDRLSSTK
jgi:uncharacterized protein YuzE